MLVEVSGNWRHTFVRPTFVKSFAYEWEVSNLVR